MRLYDSILKHLTEVHILARHDDPVEQEKRREAQRAKVASNPSLASRVHSLSLSRAEKGAKAWKKNKDTGKRIGQSAGSARSLLKHTPDYDSTKGEYYAANQGKTKGHTKAHLKNKIARLKKIRGE